MIFMTIKPPPSSPKHAFFGKYILLIDVIKICVIQFHNSNLCYYSIYSYFELPLIYIFPVIIVILVYDLVIILRAFTTAILFKNIFI